MKNKFLLILLSFVLVLSACTRIDEGVEEDNNSDEGQGANPVVVDLKDRAYAVTPLKEDKTGVDVNSLLQLDSSKAISKNFIKKNLAIEPKVDYELEELSKTQYMIKPSLPLSSNSVYKLSLTDTKEDKKDYTWAFQTKSQLKVLGTVPGKDSQSVPIETGIEINFNYENIENFEEVFEISPEVDGEFSKNGNVQVFIPEELELDTRYTVTVKKGAKVEGSDISLEEDYSFSFRTMENQSSKLRLNKYFANFTSSQVPFMEIFLGKSLINEEIDMEVYKFNSSEKFYEDIKKFDEIYNIKYLYEDFDNTKPKYLESINSFSAKAVEVNRGYQTFYSIQFPETLDKGYYLVEAALEGERAYMFIQVNDMLVYNAELEDSQFLWVRDSKSTAAISNADIVFEGGYKGNTKEDGVAQISYTPKERSRITYGLISAQGYNDFILRTEYDFIPYYDRGYSSGSKDYWKYLFTDRSTYLPSDEVNIFGYIKPKKDLSTDNLNLSFVSTEYGEKLLQQKNIKVDNIGTFTSSFKFENLTNGWYELRLTKGDNAILSQRIFISSYTKPLYTLSSSLDKEYLKAGEELNYTLKSEFFDGTPFSNGEFYISSNLSGINQSTIKTNEDGTANLIFTPSYDTNSWRPTRGSIEVYNKDAEDQRIRDINNFTFFPKDKMITINLNKDLETPIIDVSLNEIDLEKYISSQDNSENSFYRGDDTFENLKGAPLDKEINIRIVEKYYERVEKGTYYDYIDKVTKTKYEYVEKSILRENFNVSTVNGKHQLPVPYLKDSESNFQVTITLDEEKEDLIVEESYFRFSNVDMFNFEDNNLTLKIENKEEYKFKKDEEFYYYLARGNEAVTADKGQDKLLVMIMQDGVKEYIISDEVKGQLSFKESYLPNVLIQGIYINNGDIFNTTFPTNLNYDYEEMEMDIVIETDKKDYRPSDIVTIDINALDNEGNPIQSNINLSIVDEAYFDLFPQGVTALADLYSPVYSTGILKDYVSNDYNNFEFYSMAEMGGEADNYTVRKDFKDTAFFRTVKLNQEGKGSVSFKLPDNLTSWRITFQGFTEDMQSYSSKININAKLPFYLSSILSKEFITGDIPSVSLRVFGEELVEGESISYMVDLVNNTTGEEKSFSKEGRAGDYTNISLESLPKGNYTITMYADKGDYKDAVEKTFDVVDSTVYFNNRKYYNLSEDTSFDKVYSNAEITFFNESESVFYNALLNLRYIDGKRIDQKLTSLLARNFIKENFDEDVYIDKYIDFKEYEKLSSGGGVSLLPYSDADSELTAKIALLDTDYFNKDSMKNYFYNILNREDSALEEVLGAYIGLATYKEPVLLSLQDLVEKENLANKPKAGLMAAVALAEFGDETRSEEIYKSIVEKYSKENNDEIYFQVENNDPKINKEVSGLALISSAQLGYFNEGDKIFNYLYNSKDVYTLVNFEKLFYLMNRNIMDSEEIKALEGSVTLEVSGEETTYEVKGFNTQTITLTKEELAKAKIKSVKSDMAAYVYALGNVDDLDDNISDNYSFTKTYKIEEEEKDSFIQGDLIKVTINPKITDDKEGISYEINEFIPAGFRFMKTGDHTYVAENSDQRLVFRYYYNPKGKNYPIEYYIQAVLPGEYTQDYTVMRKLSDTSLWYSPQHRLMIE